MHVGAIDASRADFRLQSKTKHECLLTCAVPADRRGCSQQKGTALVQNKDGAQRAVSQRHISIMSPRCHAAQCMCKKHPCVFSMWFISYPLSKWPAFTVYNQRCICVHVRGWSIADTMNTQATTLAMRACR